MAAGKEVELLRVRSGEQLVGESDKLLSASTI